MDIAASGTREKRVLSQSNGVLTKGKMTASIKVVPKGLRSEGMSVRGVTRLLRVSMRAVGGGLATG